MSSSAPAPETRLTETIDLARHQVMLGMDMPWLVNQWVKRSPDKPFMIWEPFVGESTTWTYSELQTNARAVAAGLSERGIEKGDFVLLHMDNCPEFVVSWFACAELGAVAVSTNTRSVGRDMTYFAEHTQAVCAITQPAFAAMIHESCLDLRFIAVTDNDVGEPAEPPAEIPTIEFSSLRSDPEGWVARSPEPYASLGVQFTSGTTSRPKAVLWTHANGLWAGSISAAHMRLRTDDISLVFLPMFHTNAQAYSMLATLWSGGTFVLQPKFSASRFWDVSVKHRTTWLSTIPFMVKALAELPVPEHCYRFWGTAVRLPTLDDHLGVVTLGWWGMTETLTQGIVSDYDHPGPEHSIGRAASEYEIQVRTPGGSLAGPGESGRLFIRGVRGVSLFKEYYRNPEANDAAFDSDGWFDTGDIIRVGADGYLYFSDRDKDMLKTGGENVAASEVESVIMLTGLVEECAVVGQEHYMLDEVPVAFVIPKAGAPDSLSERIIEFCEQNLAEFKVVTAVHVVDSLPRSTLEKVAKNELRDRLTPVTDRDV